MEEAPFEIAAWRVMANTHGPKKEPWSIPRLEKRDSQPRDLLTQHGGLWSTLRWIRRRSAAERKLALESNAELPGPDGWLEGCEEFNNFLKKKEQYMRESSKAVNPP